MEANGGKTGWPPGLLQDDSRALSRWFASRPDARYIVRQVAAEHALKRSSRTFPPVPQSEGSLQTGPTLRRSKESEC